MNQILSKLLPIVLVLFYCNVTKAGVDLTVTNVTYENNQIQFQKLTLSLTLENLGDELISQNTTCQLHLSKDNTLSEDDVYAGFISFSEINANGTETGELIGGANQFGINADNSYKFIIIEVDYKDELSETNENNNIWVGSISIENAEVDIALDSYNLPKNELKQGDVLNCYADFINIGKNMIKSVLYEYYLSNDDILDEEDRRIGHLNYASFDWKSLANPYVDELEITSSFDAGEYYLFIKILESGQEIEFVDSDLSNNTILLEKITVLPQETNNILNFDEDFGTETWKEDGLNWKLTNGSDDIRQYNPHSGSGHVMSSCGEGSFLSTTDEFNVYGIWVQITDSYEVESAYINGYDDLGNTKYTLQIDLMDHMDYKYLKLEWENVTKINFSVTCTGEMPAASLFYDDLEYSYLSTPTNIIGNDIKADFHLNNNNLFVSCDKIIDVSEIYNISGQRLQTYKHNSTQIKIDISSLEKGIYILKCFNKSSSISKTYKFLKN